MHLEHYRTWGVEHSTTGRAFLFTYTAHYVRGCLLHGRCVSRESFSRPHCVGCRGDFYIHTRAGKKQSTRTNQVNARHNVAAAAPWSRRPPSAGPASSRLASPASLAQCRPCSQSVVSAAAVVIAVVAVAVAVAGVLVVVAILARRGGWSTRLGRLRHGLDRSRARDDRRSVGEKWVFRKGKVKNFLKREVFFSMNRAREERQ